MNDFVYSVFLAIATLAAGLLGVAAVVVVTMLAHDMRHDGHGPRAAHH